MKKIILSGIIALLTVTTLYAGKGKVRISSDKEGAYIYVDGKKKAMTGEGFTSILLEEGVHSIRVAKTIDEEYEYSQTKRIFVGEDTSIKVSFSLVKLKLTEITTFNNNIQKCTNGSYIACKKVGDNYLSGKGVKKSYTEAIKFYKKTCSSSATIGCSNLGAMYDNGYGVKRDIKKAVKFFKKGCDDGDIYSCTNLGVMYDNGRGVKRDIKKAVKFFQKACEDGDKYGCTNLGIMYESGRGVKKDYKKAIKFYKKGCDGGSAKGCNNYKALK